MKRLLIGLTGPAGAGKSLAADLLTGIGDACHTPLSVASFAAPVKEIARQCFGWDGKKDARGRRLLQVIGTEAGREYDPHIWTRHALRRFEEEMATAEACGLPAAGVVFDDVRFPNEAEAIRSRGGEIWRMYGRGADLSANAGHASENQRLPCDRTVDNNPHTMTRESLRTALEACFLDCLEKLQ